MTSISIPCKQCGTVKKHNTSYLEVPIKFLFFCENETCRVSNGVILKFQSPTQLSVAGRFELGERVLPPVDLNATDDIAVDELIELVE